MVINLHLSKNMLECERKSIQTQMKLQLKPSLEAKGVRYWNKLTALERLHFVLEHQGLFLNARLVNPGELLAASAAPESAQEYILEREERPFFSAINLRQLMDQQEEALRLSTTLTAAMCL